MGMGSEIERRKSFSFTYFNRPISNTRSVWYTNSERLFKHSSVVSGDYSEISAIETTPQDYPVFATPPESLCQSLDYVQMECDVHPGSDEAFDEDTIVPPKLTALKCDTLAPPENQLVFTISLCGLISFIAITHLVDSIHISLYCLSCFGCRVRWQHPESMRKSTSFLLEFQIKVCL